MKTTHITFEEVTVKGIRRWEDDTGVRRQQTKLFSQTINPFNKNPDGSIKTRGQIVNELTQEKNKWLEDHRHIKARV